MISNNYCIIMAGGVGSRFWPMSRESNPKQFLDILGVGKSFIQMTADRFLEVVPKENIYVITNEQYKEQTKEQLPFLTDEQILLETARKNTAPCIAYSVYKIFASNPNANMVITPADHLITNEAEFVRIIKKGLDFTAINNCLLTLGITPSRPETGYGYIQESRMKAPNDPSITKVKTFTEKPDIDLARVFIESGDFLWNSGIFLWNAQSIMQSFELHQPEIHAAFKAGLNKYNTPEEAAFIETTYSSCKSISIDYAILEKADNVYTLRSDFGWSDMGTWGSLFQHGIKDEDGNVIGDNKQIYRYESTGNLISISNNKVAVLEGMKNYIIVDTPDVLLICKRKEEQRIRDFVEDVKEDNDNKYI